MSKVSQIYGTLRNNNSEPCIILNSTQTEISGNLAVLQNLDVCGNITFNNTDLSSALSNLVVDLTGGQDASFNNVEISGILDAGINGTIKAGNFNVGSKNVIDGSAGVSCRALEVKNQSNYICLLAQDTQVTISGSLMLNNTDVSGKLTQIDASLVDLASGGGGVSELNDLTDTYKDSTNLVLGSNLVRNQNCNTIVGVLAGGTTTSGLKCTYIGHASGRYNSSSFSVAIGHESLRNGNGDHNTAIGHGACTLATGAYNTTVGSITLYSGSGSNNVAIGNYALKGDNINGSNNTAIGYCAHGLLSSNLSLTGSNNIIIGANSQASSTSIDNEITLGNSSNTLFRIPGLGGSNGDVLTYNNGYIEFASGGGSGGGSVSESNSLLYLEPNAANSSAIISQIANNFRTSWWIKINIDSYTNTYTNSDSEYQVLNNAFKGGVLAPNGKIIFVPHNSTVIGIYDPITDTYSVGDSHGLYENALFYGGVLAPNGKIIFVPHNSDYVGIYDPITDTYSNGDSHGTGNFAFMGGVLAPNGKIIFVPHISDYVGIYDPITNTYSNGKPHGRGDYVFMGGVLAPNGKIIFVPHNSRIIGIYDPITDTYSDGDTTNAVVNNAFNGGVLAPNGKIIFVPQQSDYVGIYDPITDTYSNGDSHGLGGNAFAGGVLAPNGKIIFVPYNSLNIGIYDPITDTFSIGPPRGSGNYAFKGGVLAPNGKIIFVPQNTHTIGIYGIDYQLTNESDILKLSPYFNKY